MPTPTYTPLANITLGSSAASVTFSSISQAYRDLVLIMNVTTAADQFVLFRFNSDSGSNYSGVWARGTGSSAESSSYSPSTEIYADASTIYSSSTTPGIITMNVLDYSATDKHKTALTRLNNTGGSSPGVNMGANRWASTSAITSIYVFNNGGNFTAGTTMALYGIAA